MSEQSPTLRGSSDWPRDLSMSVAEAAANLRMFVDAARASANFLKAVRELQHHAGTTAEELQPLGDGIRAVAAQIAEEAGRG